MSQDGRDTDPDAGVSDSRGPDGDGGGGPDDDSSGGPDDDGGGGPDGDDLPFGDGAEEMGRLLEEFDALAETVDSPAERERVRAARNAAVVAARDDEVFGQVVKGYDRADLAEAFLGSLLFGIPMFVEGGTNEVGAVLAANPIALVGTVVGAVGLVVGVLYVAEIQDVRVHKPILGVVPRRLVGVLGTSFGTALVVMTAWGRVGWSDPALALATVVAAFVPMSVGAALGDILPGS